VRERKAATGSTARMSGGVQFLSQKPVPSNGTGAAGAETRMYRLNAYKTARSCSRAAVPQGKLGQLEIRKSGFEKQVRSSAVEPNIPFSTASSQWAGQITGWLGSLIFRKDDRTQGPIFREKKGYHSASARDAPLQPGVNTHNHSADPERSGPLDGARLANASCHRDDPNDRRLQCTRHLAESIRHV